MNANTLKYFTQEEDPQGFEQSISLRREVFVDEQQGSPEIEPDDHDGQACHWLMSASDNQPIGTGRFYADAQRPETAKIGRIAIKKHIEDKDWPQFF